MRVPAFMISGCGGYIYDNGLISLPRFLITGDYSDITDCVWFVETGQEENVIFMRKGTLETKSNPISSITVGKCITLVLQINIPGNI